MKARANRNGIGGCYEKGWLACCTISTNAKSSMRLRTIFENRLPTKPAKKNKFIAVIITLSNIVLATFLPFYIGYQFGHTNALIFLAIFIILLFFDVRLSYSKKNEIELKVIR